MHKSQLKIGVVLSYISIIINIIIQLAYTPIMLRLLGQSQYGTYQLVQSVVSYLSLFSLGFGSAYVRFYSRYYVRNEEKEIAKLNGLFLISFMIIALIAFICGMFLVVNINNMFSGSLTSDELSNAHILMIIAVMNLVLTFPASVFQSYVTAKEQFIFQRTLNILSYILNPFLTLPLLLLGYGSISLILISTLITVLSFAVNVWFCIKKLEMKFIFHDIDRYLLHEIAAFSFFIFINQIIDQINWNVDKFILGIYTGTAGVALYSLGATINNVYLNFSTAVSSIFVPKVNKLVMSNDSNDELSSLFTYIGRIQFFILGLILTAFALIGKPFMILWGGNNYADSYYVALLLIIPVTIPLIQNLGIEIQRAKNKHQFRSIIYLTIAITNVLISIPLCIKFGPIGSALGTGISLIIGNGFIMNWYYDKKIGLNIKEFWKEMFKILPSIIIALSVGFMIKIFINISSLSGMIIYSLIYVLIYIVVIYLIGMNNSDREQVKHIAQRKKGK